MLRCFWLGMRAKGLKVGRGGGGGSVPPTTPFCQAIFVAPCTFHPTAPCPALKWRGLASDQPSFDVFYLVPATPCFRTFEVFFFRAILFVVPNVVCSTVQAARRVNVGFNVLV